MRGPADLRQRVTTSLVPSPLTPGDRIHQSPPMPIFLLGCRGADQTVIGLAIVSALDEILARRSAEAANIHWPGALCTAEQLDLDSAPPRR
jgi:hypothetical protein